MRLYLIIWLFTMWLYISQCDFINPNCVFKKIQFISNKMTLYCINVTISENVPLYLNLYLIMWLTMWLYISQCDFISLSCNFISQDCEFITLSMTLNLKLCYFALLWSLNITFWIVTLYLTLVFYAFSNFISITILLFPWSWNGLL